MMSDTTQATQALQSAAKWRQEAYVIQRAAWRVVILRRYGSASYDAADYSDKTTK